ncbi:transmembrane and immunoglobulin domain-containing protein 1 [Mugil cephalus]|uniref:transmembrane and immunoglobulin domain-containing protein 1 n=1 Tax=Mugil cephalus TaxID=48193 RepID=UPI001FB7F23E|nr:transmembrane and immunoglobulin domain-containing protein 1 [Mugil cephalus]
MTTTFRTALLLLLLCCATQILGISIQTTPDADGGVIATELDKTVSLVCALGASSETEDDNELVWLRNSALVSLVEENKKGRSSVCVSPVIYDDNDATFTCYQRTNDTVRMSVTLNVTYPPQLSGAEDVVVEEEAELVLQCNIQANPPVSSVSWTHNGTAVDLLAGGFSVTNDGFTSQLRSRFGERGLHEGTYSCTAVSPKYGSHSKVFHVSVTDKTIKFPLMPMIAGIVVVCLTALLAIVARWKKIAKCCK